MIYINNDNTKPLYLQIYESIRQNILCGMLLKNTALPPIRTMANELKVSKNTVEHAYQQLLEEGLIRAVKGSGYYVEDLAKILLTTTPETTPAQLPKLIPPSAQNPIRYDFRYSVGDTHLFPWTKWKQCVSNAILDEATLQFSKYESNKGFYPLRANLCTFLQRTRGVVCSPDQIVICAGTQYGLETILNLIPNNRKRVAFEEPGYIGMRKVFYNCRCDVKSVMIQEDGIDVDDVTNSPVDMVYLTPSHQFPTGVTTSLQKRYRLLEWAKQNNGYIIENDYDSEFSYGHRILPSLQSLDQNERVIYLGTLSKALFPSIRCAYYVLPPSLMKLYEKKYKHYNSALPTFVQKAITEFIKDGLLEKHIRKISSMNERKFRRLIQYLEQNLPDQVHMIYDPAGSHLLLQVDCCQQESELIAFMKERSIGIHGTKKNWAGTESPDNVFLVGFSSISEEKIEKYAAILTVALHEYIETKQKN